MGKLFDKVGARPLLVPGGILLSAILFGYTRLDASTPLIAIIGLHLLMSIALAFIFTPAFTAGLNPLPHSLHSHGSALLSTLQQLGGAAGTALLVGVMSAGTVAAAAAGKDELAAQSSGFSNGFMVAAFVSLGIVVIAAFMGKGSARRATSGFPTSCMPSGPPTASSGSVQLTKSTAVSFRRRRLPRPLRRCSWNREILSKTLRILSELH